MPILLAEKLPKEQKGIAREVAKKPVGGDVAKNQGERVFHSSVGYCWEVKIRMGYENIDNF